jgi:hypothetical protein
VRPVHKNGLYLELVAPQSIRTANQATKLISLLGSRRKGREVCVLKLSMLYPHLRL